MLFWALLGCVREDPATPGSRAAILAGQAGRIGERAAVLSEQAGGLEGRFDALRAAPGEREAIIAGIRAEALAIREEAGRLAEQVRQVEAAALVYGEGRPPVGEGTGEGTGEGGAGGEGR